MSDVEGGSWSSWEKGIQAERTAVKGTEVRSVAHYNLGVA